MKEKFETLIEGLINRQFGYVEHFFNHELVSGLRKNLTQLYNHHQMHPAGIGKNFNYQKNLEIRGDVISWLDEDSDDKFDRTFFNVINDFIQYLNESCYAGINGSEFHYALYHEGSFYKKHFDQFKEDKGRKYSFVTYLNEDWKTSDGGALVIYADDTKKMIYPKGGTVVFFKSDEVEHEVQPAKRERMSIAGWLLRR